MLSKSNTKQGEDMLPVPRGQRDPQLRGVGGVREGECGGLGLVGVGLVKGKVIHSREHQFSKH